MLIKTINDIDLENKKVLIRVDYNIPLKDGIIQDNNRIVQTLPTLKELLKRKAALILTSHLGRPVPAPPEERNNAYSLAPVRKELEALLGIPIDFCEDILGKAPAKTQQLKPGQVLLLENVRYYKEETEKDDEKRRGFAQKLASLADVFVNDAFGTAHREHASTTTVGEFLPSAGGLLMEKEIKYLSQALGKRGEISSNYHYGKTAVIGGAKVSGKIPLINNLLDKVDKILIGGGMTYTFYKAMGLEIGNSLLDPGLLDICKEILEKGKDIVVLPTDTRVGHIDFDVMEAKGKLKTVPNNAMPADTDGVDIGPDTVKQYLEIIAQSHTLIWNGPMGVFECPEASEGTFAIAKGMADATEKGAITIIGGGDSASALKQAGLQDKVTHLSTGGGASLEFLEGKTLPGVAILT